MAFINSGEKCKLSLSRIYTLSVLIVLVAVLVLPGCAPGGQRTPGPSHDESPHPKDGVIDGSPLDFEPEQSSTLETPERKVLEDVDESQMRIGFYPGSHRVEAFTASLPVGVHGMTHKTAVFLTEDEPSKVRDYFIGLFDSPAIIEDEKGLVTITWRIRELWESDDLLMVMIKPRGREGKTEIVIFSLES